MSGQAVIYDATKTFDDNFDNGPYAPDPTQPVYQNTGEPKYSFLGHKLYSPFGIAAGSLPTSKHIKYAFERGFDVNCYKTQRSVSFPVNEYPNVVYLDVDGDLTMEKIEKPLVGHLSTEKIDRLTITNS